MKYLQICTARLATDGIPESQRVPAATESLVIMLDKLSPETSVIPTPSPAAKLCVV